MRNNNLSLMKTYIKFNIRNHITVVKWERIYHEEGLQALYEEQRGQRNSMSFPPLSEDNEKDLIEGLKNK